MSFKEELKVLLTGDSKGLSKEMKMAHKEVAGFSSGMKGLGLKLAGLFSAGMAVAYAKKVASATDAQGELARRIGVTKGEVDALELSFTQGGMSIQESEKNLDTFNKKLGELEMGEAGAKKAFDQLGLSMADLAGKDFNERLIMAKNALSGLDKSAQAVIANDLFGKGGKKMMEGLEPLEKNNEMIKELNAQLGLTEGELAGLDQLGDSMTEVQKKMELVTAALLTKLVPALEKGVVGFGKLGMGAVEAGSKMGEHLKATGARIEEKGQFGGQVDMLANKILGTAAWGAGLFSDSAAAKIHKYRIETGVGMSDEDVLASAENKRILSAQGRPSALGGGAIPTELAQITGKAVFEEMKKAEEELTGQNEKLSESFKTLMEKLKGAVNPEMKAAAEFMKEYGDEAAPLKEKLAKLRELGDKGLIDKEVLGKGVADLERQIQELDPNYQVMKNMQAAEFGADRPLEPIEKKALQEAGETSASGLAGIAAQAALIGKVDEQKRMVSLQERMTELLDRIAANTGAGVSYQ